MAGPSPRLPDRAAERAGSAAIFADWLDLVSSALLEPLVGRPQQLRLRSAARHFPGDVLGALEVRLAADDPAVDLALRLKTPRQALIAAGLPLPSSTRAFLRLWSAEPSIRALVPSIWLEFDLGRESGNLPRPVVCLEVVPGVPLASLLDRVLPLLRGRPLAPRQRRMLSRCQAAIPPRGRLLYAFDLRARGLEAIRFEVLGLCAEESSRFLSELAAPEIVERFATFAPLLAGVERPHLSFDVDGEVLPRLGFEGSFRRLPEREPRWAGLLERLVDAGLCAPQKRAALLAWPGVESARESPARWPEGVGGHCIRSLSHVKLVIAAGGAPSAKGYLLLQHLDR